MRFLPRISAALLFLVLSSSLLAFQGRGFQEDGEDSLPTNSHAKAEWLFARFHYSSVAEQMGYGGYRGFHRWAADYPKSDHQFVQGVQRLTRIDTREAEQVVDANSDEIYNWPWIFVEDAGQWIVTEPQAVRLRQYLLRGGFIMFDDTHGNEEWANMVEGISKVLPGRPIEDLPDNDEIFHVLYDLDNRFQIPGTRYYWGGRPYTPDSKVPKWRGIRDDQGRLMVAICHNSDVGDAWEWADSPRYPENAMSLAYRIGINYVIYGMTH